ncbi:MAG: hypothetical protein JO227_23130 [Acetobacteraceae bacterium]|nr:hypothetical protein [Acetobacteraceae bacterium]
MNQTFALARYFPNGQLDKKFGDNGTVFTSFGADNSAWLGDQAFALAVDSQQRLVAAGSSNFGDGQSCRFALARYSPEGHLDYSFGSQGQVTTNVNSACDLATAVVTLGSGSPAIVAGGISGDPGTPPTDSVGIRFTLIGYTGDGHLDHGFGGGIVRTEHFVFTLPNGEKQKSSFDILGALVVGQNDKLVAAGQAKFENGGQLIALARYNLDGSLDQSFGNAGMVLTPVRASRANPFGLPASAAAVRMQTDGKLVVAGQASLANDDQLSFVARYESNGRLDASFNGGMVVTNISPQAVGCLGLEGWQALAIAQGGRLVAAGSAQSLTNDCHEQFVLARYNANGTPDHTFGTNGIVRTFMPSDPVNFAVPAGGGASALVIQPNGALVAGGFAIDGPGALSPVKVWALVRYQVAPPAISP